MQDILVVEDSVDIADAFNLIMGDEGFAVTAAGNGREALDKFSHQSFDLVILDIKLPEMSGLELYFLMKSMRPEINIIVMTAYRFDQLSSIFLDKDHLSLLPSPVDKNVINEIADKEGVFVGTARSGIEYDKISGDVSLVEINSVSEAYLGALTNQGNKLAVVTSLPLIAIFSLLYTCHERGHTLPSTILIILTHGNSEQINPLSSFSLSGCIFKPFDFREIIRTVKNEACLKVNMK